MSKPTPSVRRALAYIYATGERPNHIHAATRRALNELSTHNDVATWEKTKRWEELTPDGLDALGDHPMRRGHEFMTARGFQVDRNRRGKRTSHDVHYRHPEGGEAYVWRSGGGMIIRGAWKDAEKFTAEQIAAASEA